VWRPENQKQLYQSFDWEKLPDGRAATAQILHAQEELWVYGLLCDAIKRANKDAKTGFDAVIVEVLELAVGHPAVEESPGGQGQRLGRGTGVEWSGGVGQSQNRPKPAHPRFAGGGSRAGGFVPAAGPYDAAPPAADAAYREAIYVDFEGRWLSAAELDVGAFRMLHLMPFTLRVVMDERKIEPLLAREHPSSRSIRPRSESMTSPSSFVAPWDLPRNRSSDRRRDSSHNRRPGP